MSKIKTGLIVFLSGLAIYLASQLWFANTSSRNFFYTFFTRSQPQESNDDRIFVQPYRFIINYGSNRFNIEYGGMGNNKMRETCDGIIQSMLKDGERLGAPQDLNYADILEAPGYMYEYAFDIPAAVFTSAFGKNSFTDQLPAVSGIVFIPPDALRNTTIVWLLDNADKQMSGYSVKGALPPVTTNPNDLVQEVIYESSVLSSFDFNDNIFIAKKMDGYYNYPSVSIVNPYAGDELLMSVIEKNVNVFFDNPAAKLSFMGDNKVYTYVDANTVVKYYQNDVLEYSNYNTGDREATLLQSFSTALSFIKADALVINEYYLAGYRQVDKDYTFYFDYVVNNFPMVLPDEYKRDDTQNGAATLNHSIEITVRNGKVANYKKIVYNFITDTANKTAQLDFNQILTEMGASQDENQNSITDVVLGYKLERSKKAFLYWIIQLDGQTFSKIG